MFCSQNVRKLFINSRDESSYNLKHIHKYLEKSHTLYFYHSEWFPIVRDWWIYLYREQSDRNIWPYGTGA